MIAKYRNHLTQTHTQLLRSPNPCLKYRWRSTPTKTRQHDRSSIHSTSSTLKGKPSSVMTVSTSASQSYIGSSSDSASHEFGAHPNPHSNQPLEAKHFDAQPHKNKFTKFVDAMTHGSSASSQPGKASPCGEVKPERSSNRNLGKGSRKWGTKEEFEESRKWLERFEGMSAEEKRAAKEEALRKTSGGTFSGLNDMMYAAPYASFGGGFGL